MTGIIKIVENQNKKNQAAAAKTTNVVPPPVPVDVTMLPCMKLVCDQLRLNNRSQTALEEYDATTLEDLAFMTNEDYENMLATAARHNRPLCPLQQRKIAVLLWWVRNLVKDSHPFKKVPEEERQKPSFWDRLVHNPDEWMRHKIHPEKNLEVKEVDTGTVIPPNWESRFYEDLPMLKKKIREMGEKSSFSLYSDWFLNIRWVMCGYEH